MIDREKVIKGLECCVRHFGECESCSYDKGRWNCDCGKQLYADALALLKAQEPVVHAHWIEEPDRVNHWHCSNCGCPFGIASIAYRYCYVCGAKMAEHPRAADGCGQAFSPD